MMSKYLYFQPEYVSKFKCASSKCTNNCCCRPWGIDFDKATYKKYSRIKPKEKAKEILSHFEFNAEKDKYFLNERPCPFFTSEGLCGMQREYGEKFLPMTCATYPRNTYDFGKFFERSLTLTCPVAAEMILFNQEPMTFEFVEVSAKVHSNNGKIYISTKMSNSDISKELMLEVQIAMISILQERMLTIDQRLITLCFFTDKLEEIYSQGLDENKVMQLIAAYKSEEFLAEQVPLMIQSVSFDAKKFIRLMMELFEAFYNDKEIKFVQDYRRFLNSVVNTLQIKSDSNNQVSLSEVVANYEQLSDKRKDFLDKYSTFLENYLVHELFYTLYPWHYNRRPSRSLSVFLITYKIFELLMFSATQNNLSSKNDLLKLVDWYTSQIDHSEHLKEKIFKYLEDNKDFFMLMESLLEK